DNATLYQWQEARGILIPGSNPPDWSEPPASAFEDIPGAVGTAYRLPNPHAEPRPNPLPPSIIHKNGYYYRVKASVSGVPSLTCENTSVPKKLRVKGGFLRSFLPEQAKGCQNDVYTYVSDFYIGNTPPLVRYSAHEWQFEPRTGENTFGPPVILSGTEYKHDINPVTFDNEGRYTVRVTGAGCTITSSSVFRVSTAIIERQPETKSLCAGDTAIFKVVSVSNNVTYRWVKWDEALVPPHDPSDRAQVKDIMLTRMTVVIPETNNRGGSALGDERGKSRINLSAAQAGTYRVLLVNTNNNDCFETSQIFKFKNSHAKPTLSIVQPSRPNACSGDPYTYEVTVSPPVSPNPVPPATTPPYRGYQYEWKKWDRATETFVAIPGQSGALEAAPNRLRYTILEATQALDRARYLVKVTVNET
ncbi:MAG: hypothetical protein CRN43_21800, partial [Candidatus Nephrothrix sp. EaCA]